MANQKLRARTCIVDPELARRTVVELPEQPDEINLASLGDFLRSLVPFRPQPVEAEGPATLSRAGTRS